MKNVVKFRILSLILLLCFSLTNIVPLKALAIEKERQESIEVAGMRQGEDDLPPYDSPEYADWKEKFAAEENSAANEVETGNKGETRQLSQMSQINQAGLTETAPFGLISNEYLEFAVSSNGRFTIGTTGGNPDTASDNYKRMLFGHPYSTTSYTTIRLDNVSHIYTASGSSSFERDNLRCTSEYAIGKVNVKQALTIVNNPVTQRKDVVQIKYIIKNNDNVAHDTGLRIMLDTMLGGNDAAPFRIPGIGAVTKELELSGSNIPEYWQAFDTLTNPSVISQGSLRQDAGNIPDKVQFTNWSRAYGTPWGYTVNPSYFNWDSAVSVIWEPMPLLPGETEEYVTYYGLSEFVQNLDNPLAVSVTGTSSVEATETGYRPNPFTVTAYLQNNGKNIARNVHAKIILPGGLQTADGETAEKVLGNLLTGKESQVSWQILIEPQDEEHTLTYSVVVTADDVEPVTVSKNLLVPALAFQDEILYATGIEGINAGTTCAVGDPVNAATGNFLTSQKDFIIQGHNPLVFSRFYNSLDHWTGPLGNNWHHSYEMRLLPGEGKVQIIFNDGHLEDFVFENGQYLPMPGQYSKLEEDVDGNYCLTEVDGTEYTFTADGALCTIVDLQGNTIELIHEDGKLRKIANECGNFEFTYTDDHITVITDSAGRMVEYQYTGDSLTACTDVAGNTTTYEYDSKGRLIRIIDPLGNNKITNVYDEQGRVIAQTNADGTINSYHYNDENMTTTFTERNGTQIIYQRDAQNRITEKTYLHGSEKYRFNDLNQIMAYTDKNGHTYTYSYDESGNITRETDPLGQVTEYTYDGQNNVTSLTNPDGSTYTYTYDEAGNLLTATDPLERQTQLEYNERNLPEKIILPNGVFSTIQYDQKGNPVLLTDPAGNVTTYQYDDLNRVVKATNPRGNTSEYTYTPTSKVEKVTYPDGTTTEAVYDERGLLIQETDEAGRITKYNYNSIEKLTEKRDVAGGVTRYAYDSMWNISRITKPNGSVIEYRYNEDNQLAAIIGAEGHSSEFVYDHNGNMTELNDPRGGKASFVYDALNRLVTTINARQAVTQYEYRFDNQLTKIIDALNKQTTYTYNQAGELTAVTDSEGNITAYTYNSLGLVETVTDARGAVTQYEYDHQGKVTRVLYADGTTEILAYDPNGNLLQHTDARGNITTYTYDQRDRLIATQNALGGPKKITYTPTGQVAAITDENGHQTTYAYDELDRLCEVLDAAGGRTKYVYDAVDNLIAVHQYRGVTSETIERMNAKAGVAYQTEPTELITKYKYDRRGLLLEETTPIGQLTVYTYDAAGNMIAQTERDGSTTKFAYDAVNNLTKTTYDDGREIVCRYNLLDQLIARQDWLGETTYRLDALGRIQQVQDYQGRVTGYTWSPTGEKEFIKYPDGTMVNYEYDLMGRLTKVKDGSGKSTSYQYDESGNLLTELLPNGCQTKYQYDQLSRLLERQETDSKGKTTTRIQYTYDPVGNKTVITQNDSKGWGVIFPKQEKTVYEYDAVNQLIAVKGSKLQEKYFYDITGNRIRKETGLGKLTKATDYSYDPENRLTAINGKGELIAGHITAKPVSMEYDAKGNLAKISSGRHTIAEYTFDSANQLSLAVNRIGLETSFIYDGVGRRVKKEVRFRRPESLESSERAGKGALFSGGLQSFLSGEFNLANNGCQGDARGEIYNEICEELTEISAELQEELQAFCTELQGKAGLKREYNYINDETSLCNNVLFVYGQNMPTQRYIHGLDLISVDTWKTSLTEWTNNPGTLLKGKAERQYYLQDELGSPVQLLNSKGQKEAEYSYDAFGRPTISQGLGLMRGFNREKNIFSYTGYQYDRTTGLLFAQARYYMPEIGRFISEDPIQGTILNPQTLNSYIYCNNNPLTYIDPLGLMSLKQFKNQFVTGIADGVVGLSDLNALLSWDTLKGIAELGKAIYDGKLSIGEIASSMTGSALEPFRHVFAHSGDVWFGSPCNDDVYEYGRQMGSMVNTLVGAVLGVGVGAAAFKAIQKVAPKFAKAVSNIAGKVKDKAQSWFNKGAGKVSNKVTDLAKDMKDWLGKDARVITNKNGDKVFMSGDGTKRIRFDINNTSPHNNPHGHVEELANGKWVKSGPIYPTDVPHN